MSRLASFLESNGVTVITAKTLAQTRAGESSTPIKLGLMNVGDEALVNFEIELGQSGSSDGVSMLKWAFDEDTLSPPWGFAAAVTPTGGGNFGSVGTRYYVITAINGLGQTGPSLEVFAAISAPTGDAADLSWEPVPGATGYNIYRSEVAGVYTTPAFRTSVVGTSYRDTGAAVSAGAAPSANDTAGGPTAYGSPPSVFQTTPLVIGAFPVGKAVFYWIKEVIPAGTLETGNPRTAFLNLAEL